MTGIEDRMIVRKDVAQTLQEWFMAMEYNETILIVMIVVTYLGVHIIKARFMHCQYTIFNMKIRV